MATKERKPKKKSLQERQVEALESIALSLEVIGDYMEKSGIPIALSTSWGDGSVFPIDVFVHKKRPRSGSKLPPNDGE